MSCWRSACNKCNEEGETWLYRDREGVPLAASWRWSLVGSASLVFSAAHAAACGTLDAPPTVMVPAGDLLRADIWAGRSGIPSR